MSQSDMKSIQTMNPNHKSSFITLDNSYHQVKTTTYTQKELFGKICDWSTLIECILLYIQLFISTCSLCINQNSWCQVISILNFFLCFTTLTLLLLTQIKIIFQIQIQKLSKVYNFLKNKNLRFCALMTISQISGICTKNVSKSVQYISISLYIIIQISNLMNFINILLDYKNMKIRESRGVQDNLISDSKDISSNTTSINIQNNSDKSEVSKHQQNVISVKEDNQ